ncbi:MAG: hypothetical protein ACRESJ_01405 [Pseudomonas sp.]|uniref:hypothetical protein n=1 Tax=Pseudomonas sp. TaxID=306 RepID=UPI003D702290
MQIEESDWKKYKDLYKLALERLCQGVLADAETIAQNDSLSAHARYLTLYRMVQHREKDIAQTFDRFSRSGALMSLSMMIKHDLLTDKELSVLSEATQQMVMGFDRRPYKIKWVAETDA